MSPAAAPAPTRLGWLPFRVAILTVVVGLLVATCAFLLLYGLYRGQRGIDILKREYLEQVAETAAREVSRLPRTAAQVLRIEQHQIETGVYSTDKPTALARSLAGALEADRQIKWVSYSEDATGRFYGASRIKGDDVILNLSDPHQNGGVPRELRADSLTPYTRTPPLREPYEPRTREWYRDTVAAPPETIWWTPPYAFAEGETGMTAALAIRDRSGKILGVLTVDFALTGITDFLRALELKEGGVVAVFDSAGALVGGAGNADTVRALAGWRRRAAGSGAAVLPASIEVAGQTWGVAARRVPEASGLQWGAAAAVPDHSFMGPVYANPRAFIVIALAGIALAVLAGIALSSRIAGSISGVSAALEGIARFELDETVRPRSALREIARLQAAVGRVIASLRSFSRYAPEEIVREVVVTGQEAMLSGERREVTVLFSDLRGFTSFAERIRPEEVTAILNDHCDLLVGIIARHGGFVVDFLGDAVFAVFGAPRRAADHLERAVACAIEIQRARATRDNETRGRGWPRLEMGVGIDTGAAVVGNMGSVRRIKYGVVGHVVNSAARIETLTVGGQVLVSDATRRALGDRLVVDGPFEAEGKGLGASMQVWEVMALRGESMLVPPSPVTDLSTVGTAIPAKIHLILGKKIDPRAYDASVRRLGSGGVELESDAPLAVFAALQVHLPLGAVPDDAEPLDGKVVSVSEEGAARVYLVRFTGLDWGTRERIEALAARAADSASLA